MKQRRTEHSTRVHTLPGGNEDNDLWAYDMPDADGNNVICSVWEPSPVEREAIANGQNVRLMVWGTRTPPVAVGITDEKLGKRVESN